MESEIGNREWLDDYMALKQINPNNPFTVPEGYFFDLEQELMSHIRLDGLMQNRASLGFTIPESYFDELSTNIQSRITIENALNTENAGFTIPKNYFDKLSEDIQSRITIESVLNSGDASFSVPKYYFDELSVNIQSRVTIETLINKENEGLTVPENYFDNLEQQIKSRVQIEEVLNEPEESFTVPENYFNLLSEKILHKTAKQGILKRQGIVRKLYASGAFKYATAACFALVIGVGIFIKQTNDPIAQHNNSYLHKALSDVPVDDIQSYLQLHMDATDTHILMDNAKQINSESLNTNLQDYLDTTQ